MLRRKDKQMTEAEARRFLAEAPLVHLAGTGDAGQPILRTFNMVPSGEGFAFHAAPAGEKLEALGRPVVLQAEEVLTTVPSYWLHPEKACPATTLYRSVQATGVLSEVTDLAEKTAVLAALMARFQPEGGYRPLDPTTRMYRGPVTGLLVARVVPTAIVGKLAVGQHRPPDEQAKILAGLWGRGRAGDLRAFDRLVDAAPEAALPAPLAGFRTLGLTPRLVWSEGLAADLGTLVGTDPGAETRAIERSTWLGAVDADGRLVGTVRGLSDGRQHWLGAPLALPHHPALGPLLAAALAAHPHMHLASAGPLTPAAHAPHPKT